MKISVIGTGYVGLIQAVGLAEFGFNVVGIDIDETKVKQLNKGKCPLYEEGLEELLKKHINKNLTFTTSYEPIKDSDVIFLCVGTPQDRDGNADLRFLFSAVEKIKETISKDDYKVIVIKSTVPVGTNRKVKELLSEYNVDVVSNPEFLREGIAVYDFFNPERIVLGFENLKNKKPIKIMESIYYCFKEKNIPFVITNWETAELIKYASNAFLATKLSFINELAKLSDKVGADIKTVSYAMGLDPRIGNKFLNAGIGYGGSCFPKDVKALIKQFENNNIDPILIKATDKVNEEQIKWFFEKIKNYYGDLNGKVFAVLGLAFKPNTDDLRESRAIKLIDILLEEGTIVKGFDYVKKARENTINMYKFDKTKAFYGYNLYILDDLYETVKDVDGIIITVEYDRFNKEDWEKIANLVKEKVIFDGRNILNVEKIKKLGFRYHGVGR
ncbi:UDP-glucose dehydrogenase family protein [Methanocaldococcus fervens]|uniref:UDP-glucose 6-dehydrogenase n=1 Tax=Methanocaldococcus fervens (strain DSM 4213 / JCM 15782 / AG86) TaxID=573064 RepID=C7P715_METFA|nr:UDP-glucose/GDP-mannose dehydrogenase family protein [Methanocaldococcus fervens]ACV24347.1 nucleotide sugar dehydrogenase [Methanocaldococcus fervens AG86]